MKPQFFILPIVALVVVASWFGSERRSTSLLEKRSSVLKDSIAARASGSGADALASKAKSADQLAQEKGSIDWKKIVAQTTERQSGGTDLMDEELTGLRIKKKLRALSKEELVSALDEIATGDMPQETRQELQGQLLDSLCEKDPEYALTRYLGLVGDRDVYISGSGKPMQALVQALGVWAGKNPVAATAWVDQQIAAGKLDSKSLDGTSPARMRFEGSLIEALISTDPATAAARLKSLPEDQRADALMSGPRNGINDKDQLAYVELIRNGLPEKAQSKAFEWQIESMMWREGGYTKVTEYLNSMQATPAERVIFAERAARSKYERLSVDGKITRENLDAMRTWVTSQAPGTADKVTGQALALSTYSLNNMGFSKAAALATHYHEAGGNDDILISFLARCEAGPRYKKEAAVLAAKISDVKKREEILNRLK